MKNILYLVFLLAFVLPCSAGAETIIESKTINKSEVWSASKGPYHIRGDVVIEQGGTLSINSVSDIYFDSGSLVVLGNLFINASSSTSLDKTKIHFDPNFQVPQIRSGLFELHNVSIDACKSIAETYNHGTFRLVDSSISNCFDFKPTISAWNSSDVLIGNTHFINMGVPSVIEVFSNSTLIVHDSSFDHSARSSIISIHDNYASADIEYTEFNNSKSTGIESFNNSILRAENNIFNGMQSGIVLFTNAESEILKNSFIGNNIGIESYNASSTVYDNSFESNIEYAAFVSDGTFNASGNWWGNSSGPYHIQKNNTGTGDQIDGELNIAPWLLEKPNNKKCCSTVIFFPGFEGSRLYTRGLLFENQLWEPNREADIKKLFTNPDGSSIGKNIYTKDIIQGTNIGFGLFDKDIYTGFIDYLQGLKKKNNIEDFKVMPYDWRFGSGQLIQKNKENWITQILESASKSKTKKVILVGHSFGTLIIKKLLLEMKARGQSNLVDSVVFVGSPEQGAFGSVLSILHGDGQSIGSGALLSQSVARSFAQNLESVYELFPKNELADNLINNIGDFSNKPFIKINKNSKSGQIMTDLVRNYQNSGTYSFTKIQDLENFVFSKGEVEGRVAPESVLDIRNPSVGNYSLYQSHQNSVENTLVNSADLGVPGRLFNILGTGLPTISGIEYSEKCFTGTGGPTIPLIWSFGAVGARCLLDRSPLYSNSGDGVVPLGNSLLRPGAKIVLNLFDDNSIHGTTVTHTNLISSDSVVSIFNTILFGYNLSLAGASYIRVVNDPVQAEQISDSGPTYSDISDPFQDQISPVEYYRIKIDSKDPLVIEDKKGNILKEVKIGTAYTYQNKIPNVSYIQTGEVRSILLKELPGNIRIEVQNFGIAHISVDKIVNKAHESSSPSISYPVYLFPNIPLAPESKVTVSFATSTPTVQLITNSSEPFGQIIDPIVFSSTTTDPEYSLDDIKKEIRKIEIEIKKSSVELRFQDRYINKAEALLRKIDSYPVNKSSKYSTKVQESLASIINEIEEYRHRYYKGGMRVNDAAYLYIKFFGIYKMFTFLKI